MQLIQLKGLAPQEAFFKYLEDRQAATVKFTDLLRQDPIARKMQWLEPEEPEAAGAVRQRKPEEWGVVDLDNLQAEEVKRLVVTGMQAGLIVPEIVTLARLDGWEKWVWRAWRYEEPYFSMVKAVELQEIQQISEFKIILELMGVMKLQVEVVRAFRAKMDEAVQQRQERRARLRQAVDVSAFSIDELREFISSGMSSLPSRYLNANSEPIDEEWAEEEEDEDF